MSETWISRHHAATLLGVSHTTIRRREGREIPTRVHAGETQLDRHAVVALQRSGIFVPKSPGERTAMAFSMLREGASLLDVSVALRASVEEVEQLYASFERLRGGASSIRREHVARLREVGVEATTVDELVDVVVAYAQKSA